MESSGGRALLEEVCPWEWTCGFIAVSYFCYLCLCFLCKDENVISWLLLPVTVLFLAVTTPSFPTMVDPIHLEPEAKTNPFFLKLLLDIVVYHSNRKHLIQIGTKSVCFCDGPHHIVYFKDHGII